MNNQDTKDTGERIALALERIADVLVFYQEKRQHADDAKRAKAEKPPRPTTKKQRMEADAQRDSEDVLRFVPLGRANARPPGHIFRAARSDRSPLLIKEARFTVLLYNLRAAGRVAYDDRAGYYRPAPGDPAPVEIDLEPSRVSATDDEQEPFGN